MSRNLNPANLTFKIQIRKIYSIRGSVGVSALVSCFAGTRELKTISISTIIGRMENPTTLRVSRAIANRFGIASQVRAAGASIPTKLEAGFVRSESFAAKFGGRCLVSGLRFSAGTEIAKYADGYMLASQF